MRSICCKRSRAWAGGLVLLVALAACNEPASSIVGAWESPGRDWVAVATGVVDVEGGLLQLAAPVSGMVADLSAQEGDALSQGQSLLRIEDAQAGSSVAVAQAELALAQLRSRVSQARLPARLAAAQRQRQAASEGLTDAVSLAQAEDALREAQSDLRLADAAQAVARQRLAQAEAGLAARQLIVPADGVLVRLEAQAGVTVLAGTPLAVVLPARPRIVRAEVNANYVDRLREGMSASVTLDSDGDEAPEALPSARVTRISPVFAPARLSEVRQSGPVRVVEVVLAFERAASARVGQRVRVWFHESKD